MTQLWAWLTKDHNGMAVLMAIVLVVVPPWINGWWDATPQAQAQGKAVAEIKGPLESLVASFPRCETWMPMQLHRYVHPLTRTECFVVCSPNGPMGLFCVPGKAE